MSIETLLTLGVAAAILLVAAVLRFVILGTIRVGLRVSGREVPWLQPPAREGARAGSGTRVPLWPRVARRARAFAEAVVFLGSAFVEGLRIAGLGIASGAMSVARWIRPRLRDATRTSAGAATAAATAATPVVKTSLARARRGAASAGGRVKPAAILVIATVQHAALAASERVRAWVDHHQQERSSRPGEPTSAGDGPRVIDLDREFDPLTDEFPEDRVRSSV